MCLAVPGRVERIFDEDGILMGKVNFGGVVKDVCLIYLPEIQVGHYVLVHVGFAISQIGEEAALETLRMFEQLGMMEEELAEFDNTGQ
jgi:hydrogenase expression/formation protein HypC